MNKLVSVLGDSISTFDGVTVAENRIYYDEHDANRTGVRLPQQTWWAQVIAEAGDALLSNASFSGSMVAGDGFPAGCSMPRARQVLGPAGEQPDEVLIFIGINDYGWGGAMAQRRGGSEAAPAGREAAEEGFVPGEAPADALREFALAYDAMLENLKSVAPQAQMCCLTLLPGRVAGAASSTFCHRLRGIPLEAYNDAIRSAASASGCNVVDIGAAGMDYEAADGTHPTLRGMRQIAALVRASCDGTPLDGALFAGMASVDRCQRVSCVGCPHARSTGAAWSCVCEEGMEPTL